MKTVNINDFLETGGQVADTLERTRLNETEKAIIPFTLEGELVHVHYSDADEIRDYVLCNGDDCVLCQIGNKRDEKILLPIYEPVAGRVEVLLASCSLSPGSLLPQLAQVVSEEGSSRGAFITRKGGTYTVSPFHVDESVETGESAISAFVEAYEQGQIDLTSCLTRLTNEQLEAVPSIDRMLQYKGIARDDNNHAA